MRLLSVLMGRNIEMTLKKLIVLTLCGLFIGFVVTVASRRMGLAASEASRARNAFIAFAASPFVGLTAHRVEYLNCSRDKVDPGRLSTRRILYVSPAGETSEVIEQPSSKEKPVMRLVHARGRAMHIYEHLGLFFAVPENRSRPENSIRSLGDPNTDCIKAMDGRDFEKAGVRIGEESLLGYRAVKYHKSLNGTERTTWLAPDLGCFDIQTEYIWGPGATGVRTTTLQLTERLVVGPPGIDVFQAPEAFRRVKPSEAHQAVVAARLRANGVAEAEVQRQVAEILNDKLLTSLDARAATAP